MSLFDLPILKISMFKISVCTCKFTKELVHLENTFNDRGSSGVKGVNIEPLLVSRIKYPKTLLIPTIMSYKSGPIRCVIYKSLIINWFHMLLCTKISKNIQVSWYYIFKMSFSTDNNNIVVRDNHICTWYLRSFTTIFYGGRMYDVFIQ